VFVVEEGRTRLRMIAAGEAGKELTQVLAGLSAGERVVLAPSPGLRDDSRVDVTP
jgi:multidrug efflux pump subunit AcrA (membrane-fusion protein)